MNLTTYDPKKNKRVKVGEIIDEILYKEVKPQHFMERVQGYGIQEVAFQICEMKEVKKIVIKEVISGKMWESTIETWKEHGKVADFNSGKQRFLSLKYMNNHKLPEKKAEQATLI